MKKRKKQNDVEPTPKIKRYVEERIKQFHQGRTNKKEAALNAGFSESSAKSVKANIEGTRGFEILVREKGLDDASILDYLSEDIRKKPQERLGELKLAAEITGLKDNVYKDTTENEAVGLLKKIIDGE